MPKCKEIVAFWHILRYTDLGQADRLTCFHRNTSFRMNHVVSSLRSLNSRRIGNFSNTSKDNQGFLYISKSLLARLKTLGGR